VERLALIALERKPSKFSSLQSVDDPQINVVKQVYIDIEQNA
jgi:hypothetical protein